MRVAIIGGGLAGILCATQLERQGITPCIYEKNNDLAEPYRHVGAILKIILRPVKDPLQYLAHNYNIDFKPSGLVRKIIHISPSACTTIAGNLGHFLHRGAEADSIDNQLARNLKSNIYLNTEADFTELKSIYDYVIVASGYPFEARKLGVWKDAIRMAVKGTVVKGNFKTDTFLVWINKNYCRNGYAYLAPINEKEASLILAVGGVELSEVDKYWEEFIKTEHITYEIIEAFKRMHYAGFVYPHRVDNVFFIGDAGGVMDPLLGFGVFPSVITASEAVKSILYGTDYETNIKSVIELNKKLFEFRKMFNLLNNRTYDLLIRSLALPAVNPLIYNWDKINVVDIGYKVLKPFNTLITSSKQISR